MKKWRKLTSILPSGRHLGHYKALFVLVDRSLDEDKYEEIRKKQEEIADFHVTVFNHASNPRYLLERWMTIVNMMIYKEQGNVKINPLRVIHLYEANYGFLMGNKWIQALLHAQKQQTLHLGQYDRLPGNNCTSITFLEEIRLDYSRVTQTPFANFYNNAAACYNQILTALSSLTERKFRIHQDVAFVHATTLEEGQYKLKLATRTTNTAYKHCIAFPIHGTGQGSTDLMIFWHLYHVHFSITTQKKHMLWLLLTHIEIS